LNKAQYRRNSFCSYCGTPFADLQWPRKCAWCGNLTFQNPIPVVVGLIPVNSGVLVIRRGVAPRKGWLALPGGYIEVGESYEAALVREVYEETGLELNVKLVKLINVRSALDGTLIIFATTSEHSKEALPAFSTTDETTERMVIGGPIELAFPMHTELVEAYFNGNLRAYKRLNG
jgi:ADP-ribose pyrophosphatase YjhB (NUDIX family)